MTRQRAFWLMFLVTAAWGASYMWMKLALASVGPFMLVGLRFSIAFVVTSLVFWRLLNWPSRNEAIASLILGTLLFSLFSLVMTGLEHTDASTAGFLLSTTAVFVTILDTIRRRIWPRPVTLITTLTVILGLYFLVANGRGLHLNIGALFCLGCAALYAVYILYSDRLSRHGQATFNVSIWQLGVAGVEGLCLGTLTSGFQLPQTGAQWGAVLALGIICSAFGFVGQNAAQRYLTPETVSLIYSLEPIFSAIFAFLMLGEVLTGIQYLGAALIFASIVISEVVKAHHPLKA